MSGPFELMKPFRGPVSDARLEPIWRSVPAVLYLGMIHALSSVQGPDLPPVVDDRVAHFVEYFGLGVLLYLAASGFDRRGRSWIIVVAVVSFAAAWGALDEFHQSFVPGRDSSVKDLVFDVAGATVAALVVRWLAWRNVSR